MEMLHADDFVLVTGMWKPKLEAANFRGSGSCKRVPLPFCHSYERQKLACGASFCEIYDDE